jgi:hypothetical protein
MTGEKNCRRHSLINLFARWQQTATGIPPAAILVARCVVNFSPFLFPIIQRRHGGDAKAEIWKAERRNETRIVQINSN